MDDPVAIAGAFAANAKKVVDASQVVVTDAVKKINANPGPPIGFTTGDALKTMTELAKIALNGGIAAGQIALEVKPSQGVLLLADHLATLATQSVEQAAAVVEGSDLIAKNKFSSDDVVQTAIKLANIALLNGADAVQTVAAGPAQYADPIKKQTFTVAAHPSAARQITVGPIELKGPGPAITIPAFQISLDPANGVLPVGATEFTLIVNSAGLASGTYVGHIVVDNPAPTADETIQVTLLL